MVDSGYSVDNLPPHRPPKLTAEVASSGVILTWGGNPERDLWGYRLHRGTELTFRPDSSNTVYAGPDTAFFDTTGAGRFYKLAAVDVHGNRSRYALVTPRGSTTSVAFLVTAQAEPNRVTLDWYVIGLPGVPVNIYRRTVDRPWQRVAMAVTDHVGMVSYRDNDVRPGARLGYRLGTIDGNAEEFSDETWVTVPEPRLALLGVAPNPVLAEQGLFVKLSLPEGTAAILQVLDISGRVVARRDLSLLGPGTHEARVTWEQRPAPGVYWVRLRQGAQSVSTKIAILR